MEEIYLTHDQLHRIKDVLHLVSMKMGNYGHEVSELFPDRVIITRKELCEKWVATEGFTTTPLAEERPDRIPLRELLFMLHSRYNGWMGMDVTETLLSKELTRLGFKKVRYRGRTAYALYNKGRGE